MVTHSKLYLQKISYIMGVSRVLGEITPSYNSSYNSLLVDQWRIRFCNRFVRL